MDCDSLKKSVLQYVRSEVEVLALQKACLLSLPIKVLDGANAEVFVEDSGMGTFLVHDGGKTVGHLEASGVIVTEKRLEVLADLAARLGASLDNGIFKMMAKTNTIQDAAFAVGQCCSVGLYDLLTHSPSSEEEQIRARVDSEISDWSSARGVSIEPDRKVNGSVKQYVLDYVAATKTPIAISILLPSYNPTVSADRYALQVLDLRQSKYKDWKQVAILGRPERWKTKARRLVDRMASGVADIPSPGSLYPSNINETLDSVAA